MLSRRHSGGLEMQNKNYNHLAASKSVSRQRKGRAMKAKPNVVKKGCAISALTLLATLAVPVTQGTGSRKDDIVFGPTGHPIAGATVTVCMPTATGTPCSPLSTIYTDATLTVPTT